MMPYTLQEVKLVVKKQYMDIYHRALMEWLISEVERLELEIRSRQDLIDLFMKGPD